MKVMKFGGTSVQDAAAIQRVFEIVMSEGGKTRTVVVSAMSKITDSLVDVTKRLLQGDLRKAQDHLHSMRERQVLAAKELNLTPTALEKVLAPIDEIVSLLPALVSIGEVSPRSQDRILALGEVVSSLLVSEYFKTKGVTCEWVDSRKLVRTDSQYGTASVDFHQTQVSVDENLGPLIGKCEVIVCGGFIGSDSSRHTTTLGRGGSDYSASIIGAAAGAERIEIWTDVDGVLTTDPRMVKSAQRVLTLGFDEAAELAYFGAKVLHPATIFPAVKKNIPVVVLNSKNPTSPGTLIQRDPVQEAQVVKAIAFKRNVTLVNIHSTRMLGAAGFLKSIFDVFAKHKLSVDLISTSEVSVSLTLDGSFEASTLQAALSEFHDLAETSILKDKSTVSIIGAGIRQSAGVASRIFHSIRDFNVSMISMGASEVNVSLVVDDQVLPAVVTALHSEFFS